MTSQKLRRLSNYWRRRLHHQGWQISIEFVNEDNIGVGNVGECVAQLCDRTGNIKILRDDASDHDIEGRILHEWCHIIMHEMIPKDKIKAELFEAGLEQFVRTLMEFKYGKKL